MKLSNFKKSKLICLQRMILGMISLLIFNSAFTQNVVPVKLCLTKIDVSEFDIEFRDIRPSKDDSEIMMCLPAAFTSTNIGLIDGVYVIKGNQHLNDTMHRKYKGDIWGGLSVLNNKLKIYNTDDGKLSKSIAKTIAKEGGDFFEQFLLLSDYIGIEFDAPRLNNKHERRALVIMDSGEYCIIESDKALGLNQFVERLKIIGVRDAIYLDMGTYGEGWYKDKHGKLVVIYPGSSTTNQTNWLVFLKKQ